MTIRPLNDRVVVRPLAAETTTTTGIFLPSAAMKKSDRGEVVAVGSGVLTEEGVLKSLAVKPGDQVLFGKYPGFEVRSQDEDLLIMKADDILAIVESDDDDQEECAA